MGWGRIDDGFDDHPKVLALLGEDDQAGAAIALGLWTLCFTWAHRNTRKRGRVGGLLPAILPRRFIGAAGPDAAKLLVKHGLWDEHEDGGWLIHDFGDYLPNEETRAARAAAGRRGAEVRWAEKHAAEAEAAAANEDVSAGDDGTLPSTNGKLPQGSHAAGSNAVANDGSRAPARRVSTTSSSSNPEPVPEPDQPSAAGATRSAPPLSVTQRSKRITDAYAEVEPMCKWPAVNGIVIRAIKAEKWSDEEIQAALLRMAKEGRSVGVESLRIELSGFTPRSRAPAQAPYRDPANQDDYDDWKGPTR